MARSYAGVILAVLAIAFLVWGTATPDTIPSMEEPLLLGNPQQSLVPSQVALPGAGRRLQVESTNDEYDAPGAIGSLLSLSSASSSSRRVLLGANWQSHPRGKAHPEQAKRGICWQFNDWMGARAARPFDRVAWTYNWGLKPNANTNKWFGRRGIEFVPMMWSRWGLENLERSIPRHAKHLLGFNEPNHLVQAKLTPQEAADLWPQLEKVARKKGLRLGSPAAAPCGGADCVAGYGDPFKWMDDFLDHCDGCKMDFVATHIYSCNLEWVKKYLQQYHERYKMPVWLTEFSCPGASADAANAFLKGFISWADDQAWLERYAWFALDLSDFEWIGKGANLMNYWDMELTELGKTYNSYTGGVSAKSMQLHGRAMPELGAKAEEQWGELCGQCAQLAAEANQEEQEYCKWDCGYWDSKELVRPRPEED